MLVGKELENFIEEISCDPEIFISVLIGLAYNSTYVHIDKPTKFFLSSR